MRAELLMNEAKLYTGERECFIHVEKANESDYAILLSGSMDCMLQGVFNVISRMSELSDVPVKVFCKMLTTAAKTLTHHTAYFSEKGELRSCKTEAEKNAQEIKDAQNEMENYKRLCKEAEIRLESCKKHYTDIIKHKEDIIRGYRSEINKANQTIDELYDMLAEAQAQNRPNVKTYNGGGIDECERDV